MISTAVLFVFLLVVIRPAHAEEDGMICETIEIEQGVHGAGLEPSTEIVTATLCQTPAPLLEGCTLAEGTIRYDSRFEASKVLPDLQKIVDSGADTLCVEIIPPYYNVQSWMEIPGWDEYKAEFPDVYKRWYAETAMTENRNSILQFLRDNNAALKSHYGYHNTESIPAAIPAGLLAALTDRDDVVNVDTYGKTLDIPWHVKNGHESKVMDLLQMEIDHGKQNCTFQPIFDNCPPLERNADGEQTLKVIITLEPEPMWPDGRPNPFLQAKVDERSAELRVIHAERQQPLVDFMIQNNQTVVKQLLRFNIMYAVITLDFLPELEARDEIMRISSSNSVGCSGGGSADNPGCVLDPNFYPGTMDRNTHNGMKITETHPADNARTPAISEQFVQTGSPLQQIEAGSAPSDVQCREGLILTMLTGGRPVCVTESTAQVLAERGLVQ